MPYGEDGCKTYFSSLGAVIFLFGLFVAGSIFGITVDSMRPGFPGFGAYFVSGNGLVALSPAVLGIIIGLASLRRVRFEWDHAALYYFTFFPVRIDYAEVVSVEYPCRDPGGSNVPDAAVFQMRSGGSRKWKFSRFSTEVRQEIVRELESRIRTVKSPAPADTVSGIQKWADKVLKPSRSTLIVSGLAAVILLVLFSIGLYLQLRWDKYIRTWDKADGIILKNETRRVRSGKSTRLVSDVEYQYTYQGKRYFGTRIAYDSEHFPGVGVGSHRQVIVNPADPRDSAIMIWYRGYWGFFDRFLFCIFVFIGALAALAVFLHTLAWKRTIVPEELEAYLKTFPPERLRAAAKMKCSGREICSIEMRRPMEYRMEQHYSVIRNRDWTVWGWWVLGIPLLLSVIASVYDPLVWIVVVILGIITFYICRPRMTVFDFHGKKIFSCGRFAPEKFAKAKSLPFSEVDHLRCSYVVTVRGSGSKKSESKFFTLSAVERDGTVVPLCRVPPRKLRLLLDLLPELAEKMGHVPVIYGSRNYS
jgi:hypothetical protein